MSTADWLKYQIFCETDQRWEFPIVEEGDPEPTKCPVDHSHTVNVNSVDLYTRRSHNEVSLTEESIKTGGHFETHTATIDADCEAVTTFEEVMFVDQSVLSISYTTTAMHCNDTLTVYVGKDTTVGYVTAPVVASAQTFTVSSTVFDHAFHGPCRASIFDGVNRARLGRIQVLDKNASTVATEFGSQHIFLAGPTTLFQISPLTVRDVEIGPPAHEQIGATKIGASHIKKDIVVSLEYTNRSKPWPIGRIVANVGLTDSTIQVDDDVLSSVELGDKLQLADKVQSTISIGQVTEIDKLQGTITVSGASTGLFLASTPTFVVKASKKFVARVEELQ